MWILSILSFVVVGILKIIGGIVLTYFGLFALNSEWKIRYVAPICFLSLFSIFTLVFYMLFRHEGDYIQLFVNEHLLLNQYAKDVFLAASLTSGSITLLLIVSIWAARNGEGIDII